MYAYLYIKLALELIFEFFLVNPNSYKNMEPVMTEILDRFSTREFVPVVGDAVPYYNGSKMCENTFTCLECGEQQFFKDNKKTAGKKT